MGAKNYFIWLQTTMSTHLDTIEKFTWISAKILKILSFDRIWCPWSEPLKSCSMKVAVWKNCSSFISPYYIETGLCQFILWLYKRKNFNQIDFLCKIFEWCKQFFTIFIILIVFWTFFRTFSFLWLEVSVKFDNSFYCCTHFFARICLKQLCYWIINDSIFKLQFIHLFNLKMKKNKPGYPYGCSSFSSQAGI